MSSEAKDGQFLYSDDLVKGGKFAEFSLTISEVVPPGGITYANKRKTGKPALRFEETKKAWELPKTQERLLKLMLGKDFSRWAGQRVTLHAAYGQTPMGEGSFIRVRPTVRHALIPIGVRAWFGEDLTGTEINTAQQ